MSVDLTGGIDPSREFVFAERPENPEMRDSVSFWTFDDRGTVGLPRMGVEAVSENWDSHDIQVNVAFPDGRTYRLRETTPSHSVAGHDGLPRVLGAGGLRFESISEFDTWKMTYEGKAVASTSADLIDGNTDGPLVDIRFGVEATMAVPPWVQGAMREEAQENMNSTPAGDLMGGPRYEQLYRATGYIAVDGGEEQTFTGSGLRIRRQGVRRLTEFWGHCWQSAVFPSGKAFGYMAYPPRDDGVPSFNEGFIFRGDGELLPARVVKAPWLTRLQASGDDASLVLETDEGRIEIEGETAFGLHDVHHKDKTFSAQQLKVNFPVVHQAGVRYRWDGEEAYGMMERSNPIEKITHP
ncbi:hypothetical protein [Rhodococcus artemisiae]|uniref:Tocopherol cyclase-like protein n=1 Tax=Rhodococcus artemisiae TaxID=714159 RepID=A0ABU7L5T7_9NOCA|nr:hypothetical protein [Rhodococcus artemisiae]MEE2056912.1 hypothetical protein [Rhodococcus artemisiae]